MHIVYFWVCFVIALFVKEIVTDKCQTPEKQEGQCRPLHDCPEVLKAYANPPKGGETYLRQYLCKDGEGVEVCCDNSSSIMMLGEQHLVFDSPEVLLDDALPVYYEDDSYDGVLPEILAKHPESGVEYVKCYGALINLRYVITAAECVAQNDLSQKSAIIGVRFTSSNGSYFFGVEEETPHPFYDPATKINDVALLRLNRTVEDGVRLHISIETVSDFYEGEDLSVQWRKKVFILEKFLSTSLCREILKNKNGHAVVTEYDICTEDLGNSTEITCNEYAGTPLIYKLYDDDNIMYDSYLLGISSSKIGCADGLPNVYTNLIQYRLWLRDNMRPWLDESEHCKTPSGDAGQSLPIYYCPALLEMSSDVTNATRAYLDKIVDEVEDYGDIFFVCCPKSPNSDIPENENVLPNIEFVDKGCGLLNGDDHISSSTAIETEEFPWIASIVNKDYNRSDECGGVLINARYVLTTAKCMMTADVHDLIVRLGNLTNQNEEDCFKDVDTDGTDCTDTEYFGVEDLIRHPFYVSYLELNNVALIRLNKTVKYTDFIRPICLPVEETVTAKPGDILYKSGWFYDESEERGGKKITVSTGLLSNIECQRNLRIVSEEYIDEGTMCTRNYNNTPEEPIYGAAVMFSNKNQWHVEGIFDSGYVGLTKSPSLYTNISKYVNWIFENMQSWK